MKFLPLIWNNLKRKKLRTLLTVLSVLVAFILYGYLAAVKNALAAGVSVEGANRLVIRQRISLIQPLPLSYKARMEKMPGVAAVAHASWFGGVYQDPKNFFAQIAVEPKEYLEMFPEFILSDEAKRKWMETRTGAIVGRATADKYKWKVGDRIPLIASIWKKKDGSSNWEFEIVGIYEGKEKNTDTTQMFFRYDYFDEARAFGEGQIGWYTVRVKDPREAGAIAAKIDEEFANSPSETKAETEGAFVAGFAKQIGDIGLIMVAILSAVFFTILLVSGNTMGQSVRERTEELGVLKAMGFTNTQVLFFVLGESCCISVLGGVLGLGIAWALIAGGDPTRGSLPRFSLPSTSLAVGLLLTLALGIVSGILPAIQAMRLRIAEALRRN